LSRRGYARTLRGSSISPLNPFLEAIIAGSRRGDAITDAACVRWPKTTRVFKKPASDQLLVAALAITIRARKKMNPISRERRRVSIAA
jgi:hypothetical protein